MPTPLVSVLMTAYNREKYIAEAIESVLASTFADFELIVVDDASRDHTAEIARRYTTDPRVQAYVNETNLTDYCNRNRAASYTRGKYLKYLDSDDTICLNGLEVMVREMERFPDAALGLCRLGTDGDTESILFEPEQAYRYHFLATGLFHAGPSGSIVRSDAFRAVGGFSGKRFIGDIELWLRLGAHYPVLFLRSGLVSWRTHPDQEIRHEHASLMNSFLLHYQVEISALTSQVCPLRDAERERAVRRLKQGQARAILRMLIRERRLNSAVRLYRDSCLSINDLARGFRPISFETSARPALVADQHSRLSTESQ